MTVQPADPDRPCPHPDFAAIVAVARTVAAGQPETNDTTANGFSAEIRVECAACGERFRWVGVPHGLRPDRPACSIDEFELRAPLRPASADSDFGMGLPGFSLVARTPERASIEREIREGIAADLDQLATIRDPADPDKSRLYSDVYLSVADRLRNPDRDKQAGTVQDNTQD